MKIKLIAKIKDVIIGYVFDTDTNITIGREIGNTIAPIIDSISRHHAHIFFADGAWKVEDLGSTNGSLINGKKVEGQVALKAGDALRFGLIDMSVSFDQPAGAAPAAAAAAAPAAAPAISPISPAKPAAAPALSPISPAKPAAAPALEPVADLEPIAELEPVAEAPKSPLSPAAPAVGGVKPGLKLPARPTLAKPGIKLPARPTLKLPPKKA